MLGCLTLIYINVKFELQSLKVKMKLKLKGTHHIITISNMKQYKWNAIIIIYIFGQIRRIFQVQAINDSPLIFDLELIILKEPYHFSLHRGIVRIKQKGLFHHHGDR